MVTKNIVSKETVSKIEKAFGCKVAIEAGNLRAIVAELGWVYVTIDYTNEASDDEGDRRWLVGASRTTRDEDCDVVQVPDVDTAIAAARVVCFAAQTNMRRGDR